MSRPSAASEVYKRQTQNLKVDPKTALPKAAADCVKGALGLAVITLGYKFISQS